MLTVQVCQPYSDPTYPGTPSASNSTRRIKFLHPGYKDAANILLQFDAYDADCGIHFSTAHTACAIVAENRWDGYFSTDSGGVERIEQSTPDQILEDDIYYFHVPGEEVYPVVPTFADWCFPHHALPVSWRRSPSTASNPPYPRLDRDHCCMTRSTLPLESAHIVPANASVVEWWNNNGMSQYGERNSPLNTARFRVDVHQVFDRKPRFAIVPKGNTFVAHIFHAANDAAEAVRLYHNVPLQFLEDVKLEFLLARMAWTLFPYLEIFLSSGRRRKVSRFGENGVRVVKEVDGRECHQIYLQSTSRSVSPRKRQAGSANQEPIDDGDDQYDDDAYTDDEDEYRGRGRKRRRSSSVTCTSTFTSDHVCRSASEVSTSHDAIMLASLQT